MADINVEDYSQIPYKDGGRTREGVDCFGLVMLVHRECFGRIIPDICYNSAEDCVVNARLVDVHAATINARRTHCPEPGDLVLMRVGGQASHVGIYVAPQSVMHALAGFGVICQRISASLVRHRIEGYFRVE